MSRAPTMALVAALVVGGGAGGCKGAPAPPTATPPGAAATQPAVDPGWGDDDSRRAVEDLTRSCRASTWPERFKKRHGRTPTLVLGRMERRSTERVDPQQIARQLSDRLAAAFGPRVKLAGEGQPGDLLLLGRLSSQVDRTALTAVRALLLSLSIVEVSSAEVVWADGYLVRKLITRTPPARQGAPAGPDQVRRLLPNQTVDVSGVFNDYDAVGLAQAAVNDLLSSGWLEGGGAPVVRIYQLRNRTSQQINSDLIAGPLVRALVRHPRARIVIRPAQAHHLRAQRLLATSDAGPLSHRAPAREGPTAGQELAVTHLISLVLTATTQARRGVTFTNYTFSAAAVSVGDSRRVWSFSRSIQKVMQGPPVGAAAGTR